MSIKDKQARYGQRSTRSTETVKTLSPSSWKRRSGKPPRARSRSTRRSSDLHKKHRARARAQRGQAHRRPQDDRHPPDHLRGRPAPARARLGALHARRDPGAGDRRRSAPRRTSSRSTRCIGDVAKRFMLHYNFPPVLDRRDQAAARPRPPRDRPRRPRRARARARVLPPTRTSPTPSASSPRPSSRTARSSMAAVCGGSLSLMDAGVPIKTPVAGIAMGLIKEGDKVAILSDILGDEDHLGDMDFKVCGTKHGITAIQMDIKIQGLTREILEQALDQARDGRLHILGKMPETLAAPRDGALASTRRASPRSRSSPTRSATSSAPAARPSRASSTRPASPSTSRTTARSTSPRPTPRRSRRRSTSSRASPPSPRSAQIYKGTVRRIADFGAFVEILPGTDGLLHISRARRTSA